jgi:4-amino-4-deoxy-L-arabinose transferase-like glycosyltransferase
VSGRGAAPGPAAGPAAAAPAAAPAAGRRAARGSRLAAAALALIVLALLLPFLRADPPAGLTVSNAVWTDEGFNLANARARVLSGRFATGDVDRSLTNGAYSAAAAGLFAVTGPRLWAGRVLSAVSVAGAVLLLALGLAGPLGRPAALLAAAALGGADLVLEYGRLALVESMVVLLLAAAFVLAARAAWRPSPAAGAGLGLLLAAAVSVKAIALLPGAAMVAVVLAAALARRDRPALRMGLAAVATAGLAAAAWLLLVALPNWERLRTALRIWPTVDYLGSPAALAGRLGHYLTASDQAVGRSAPLLLAAAVGVASAGRRWRALPPAARDALVMAALWGVGLWLAVGVGDYLPDHYEAPNRYVVPALPGLAVLAGHGLAAVAGAAGRRGAATGVALALAVAAPGAARYLGAALGAGEQRERDQRVLAGALLPGAVVLGAYAPTLLFDTRAATLTPWPPADANVRDPVGRLGVTHLLVGGPADPTGGLFPERRGLRLLARVRWGREEVDLYRLAPRPGPG